MSDEVTEFNLRVNQSSGQLWLDDRRVLWNTVRELKPQVAAETGTWQGGGSTFFILEAMRMNGCGVLHSVESDATMHTIAAHRYGNEWSYLAPYLRLHLGDSVTVYREELRDVQLDLVFIDGGDKDALAEFNLLAPKLRLGGALFCHDWHNGKAEELKPVLGFAQHKGGKLFDHPDWDITITGTGDGYFERGSVGLMKAIKLR